MALAWPTIFYFILYVPVIVPRLGGWHQIPLAHWLMLLLPLGVLIVYAGALASQARLLVAACVLAAGAELSILAASELHLPGFRNTVGSSGSRVLVVLTTGLLVFASALLLLEAGYLFNRARSRRAAGRVQPMECPPAPEMP